MGITSVPAANGSTVYSPKYGGQSAWNGHFTKLINAVPNAVLYVDQREYQTTLRDTTTNVDLGTLSWSIKFLVGLSPANQKNVYIKAQMSTTVLWNSKALNPDNIEIEN